MSTSLTDAILRMDEPEALAIVQHTFPTLHNLLPSDS